MEVILMKISISKIDYIMATKRLKSYQVAENSGMSRQNFSTVKKRGTCSPNTVAKIAVGLGVSIDEIIENDN